MAYREIRCTSSSNESSDTDDDETYWKRRKSTSESFKSINHNNFTKPRNRVWWNVTNEQKLNCALSAANIPDGEDTHFIDLDSLATEDQIVDGSRKVKWDDHLFGKNPPSINWNRVVSRTHIGVNFSSSPEAVIEEIISLLQESNHDLIVKVVENLGVQRALEYYYLTEDIEENGGMFLKDGSRRRSPGGVYLNLIKISPEVSRDERKAIFFIDRQIKDKLKRRRREIRKQQMKANRREFDDTGSNSISIQAPQESVFPSNHSPTLPNVNHEDYVIEDPPVNSPKPVKTYEEGELPSSGEED